MEGENGMGTWGEGQRRGGGLACEIALHTRAFQAAQNPIKRNLNMEIQRQRGRETQADKLISAHVFTNKRITER